jgi:hypothetical protein
MRPHSTFRIHSAKQDMRPPSGLENFQCCAICGPESVLPSSVLPERVNFPQMSAADCPRRGQPAARTIVSVAQELATESAAIVREE